ncbi:AfsR/SARP family transcriptional regulator [Plantactinospora sp. DSM 117369]
MIATRGSGYVIQVEDGRLDVQRHDQLVSWAEAVVAEGDHEKAVAVLREALALWRGPALDIPGTPVLEAAARRGRRSRRRPRSPGRAPRSGRRSAPGRCRR